VSWPKIFAFLKKEFLTEISYRFAFLLHIFGSFVWLLTFYFIDKLFAGKIAPHLQPYGVNYFSYVLLGLAFFTYVGIGVSSFAVRIRNEQLMGTLEALVATPTRFSTIIAAMGLWSFIWASVSVFIYLTLGACLFGVDLTGSNLLSCLVILLLTLASFSGLGLLAAGLIMILKRGQPVTAVVNTLFKLLGGVYFPIAVLPDWLRTISYFLPVTYSIKAMQLAVYKGYPLSALKTELAALAIFSAILLPLGLLFFNYAFRKTKLAGTLTQY